MQAKKVLYILRKIAKALSFTTVMQCHVQTIYSIVLPVLCYGAEVWGTVKFEEIEKVQFQFCKFILQVPTTASTTAVMAELGRSLLHPAKSNQVFCLPQLYKMSHTI